MIEINNLTTTIVDEEFLRKIAERIIREEIKKEVDLSIALLGSGRMQEINKRYRGKNKVTDVLSFAEVKVQKEKFKVGPLKKIQGLGEIVICLREVKKNAKRYGSNFGKELNRVLIHGLLHLLGYDHEKNEKEAEEIRKKEDYYLNQI